MMFLYIDPGTGSMLFAVLMGVVTTLVFAMQGVMIKFKSRIGTKNVKTDNKNKEDLIIFSDHKRYDNVFVPILDELENRKIKTIFYTMSSDDPVINKNYQYIKSEFIGEGNTAFAKLNLLNAKVLLSTTPGLDVYQWKRSKNVDKYIHIYHDIAGGLGYRMFGIDFYDVIFTVSTLQNENIREIEEKRNLKSKELVEVGSPYFDELIKKYESTSRVKNSVPVVLIAPSWGYESLLVKYGDKIIDNVIKTGYKVVVRPHPQSWTADIDVINNLIKKYGDKIEFNKDNDNFDVLNKSDIMISDFSSVMLDYAFCFDKPYMYYLTDKGRNYDMYDACWLDDPKKQDIAKLNCGIELTDNNINDLKELLNENNEEMKKLSEKRKYYKNISLSNIGNSAKIIVDNLERYIN